MSWIGFYPYLYSTTGLFGHTYILGHIIATNLTLIILVTIMGVGMLMVIHSEMGEYWNGHLSQALQVKTVPT